MNPLDIKGTTVDFELKALGALAREVPEDGWIVEIGSYCGRGSLALGQAKHPSVRLTCVDPFPIEPLARQTDECYADYCLADWEATMTHVVNLEAVRDYRTLPRQSPDLLVLDNPRIYQDLLYWHELLKPGAKVCVLTSIWKTFPDGRPFTWWTEQMNKFLSEHPQYHHQDGLFSVLTRL